MLTAEQLEKQLKDTADAVEKGIKDINEKKATKAEVVQLIDDRTKDDKAMLAAHKGSIAEINTGLVEAKAAIEESQKQFRNIKNIRSSSFVEHGKYKGHFSSPQEAKTFALLCICASTEDTKVASKFDWAKKQLDAMGIEPYRITESGTKAMTGSSQVAGGTLVMVEQVPSIIDLLETYGKLRANATIWPMGAGQTIIPKLDGLLTMYVPGEGGSITQTTPSIPAITLLPKTLTGLTAYGIELEEDSLVALGELLGGLFARSCAYYEDLCGFLGDGTSTYFGYKGITAALMAVSSTIASIKSLIVGTTGYAYSNLALSDFEKVPGILPDKADDGDAKWYVHRYFYWTVMVRLALTSTSMASEVILGASARTKQFLGYPVEFTQVMPKVAAVSQICALLANLRQGFVLGTRGGIEIAQSEHRYFDQGLVGVRVRDRVALNAHGVGDTTNAGPICGLITYAS